MKVFISIISTVFLVSCFAKKQDLAELRDNNLETIDDVHDCNVTYESETPNALQHNNELFNLPLDSFNSLVGQIAANEFKSGDSYRITYNFAVHFDSNGIIRSTYFPRGCGAFCSKIDSLIRNQEPLNPPFFDDSHTNLGSYDSIVNISVRFENLTAHSSFYYPQAILPYGRD